MGQQRASEEGRSTWGCLDEGSPYLGPQKPVLPCVDALASFPVLSSVDSASCGLQVHWRLDSSQSPLFRPWGGGAGAWLFWTCLPAPNLALLAICPANQGLPASLVPETCQQVRSPSVSPSLVAGALAGL